jgi:hypothetical protein
MPSRFAAQGPDPAIKRNIARARRGKSRLQQAQGWVVAASLALTLTGWGLLAQAEAQQLAQAAPAPAQIAAPGAAALPLVADLQELWSFLTSGMPAPAGAAQPVAER